jgi:hypothetical protein
VLVFRYTVVAYNKLVPNKIPNVFSLSEAIANKVLSYVTSRDNRGPYQSLHMAWVQAIYVPCIH